MTQMCVGALLLMYKQRHVPRVVDNWSMMMNEYELRLGYFHDTQHTQVFMLLALHVPQMGGSASW